MLPILWQSAWRAGVVIVLMAGGPAFASIEPPFYVGGHDQPAIVGSPQVDSAMRRIVVAANDAERNSALAAAQKLAEAGDATAAFRLARYYHLETSHPNYALARALYTRAMERGNPWAANNIGLLYRDGAGVPRDYSKAREYFEKGAARGSPLAYYNLALLSLEGADGPRNVPAGLEWLNKGAARGISLCLYEEAALYYTGDYGVPVDLAKTITLGTRAAVLGDRSAAWGVAKLYLLGKGVPLDAAKGIQLLRTLSE